ncbi:ROK family transcriptional regulator [Mesorhizobium sp. M0676]|uniref:ROK family transcriptional regulator n=1 Tax=Mesorhizobium sp. M0676 TaxID=2956984 RepID=UPI003338BB80
MPIKQIVENDVLVSTDLRPNETRALAALFRAGALSRAALARDLGLTRSTTGALVLGLTEAGLARERSDGADDEQDSEGRVGRPGILVEIDGNGGFFLGAYIGVNWIAVVTVDLAGARRASASRAFAGPGSTPEAAVDIIGELVAEIRSQLPAGTRPYGLNVAVPGFPAADGISYHATILGWHGVNLAELLRTAFGADFPILLENDANAVAVAETYRSRPGNDDEDALVILIENGVGGGIINAGRLHRGQLGGAGEIGHLRIGDEGFVFDAKRPGRLESYVGKDALLARYLHISGLRVGLHEFVAALADGDPPAVATARDWALWFGRGLATLACTLQPERIILSGSVNAVYPFVAKQVEAFLSDFLAEGYPVPTVELSRVGADGPALGAACLLHQAALSGDPQFQLRGLAAR